jgi:hypothetical protein
MAGQRITFTVADCLRAVAARTPDMALLSVELGSVELGRATA